MHVYGQNFELFRENKRENISFRMIKNLMIIPLKINGKGPFNFVLDTGVGLMIISDPKLIDSLQISNLKNIKISGLGGGEDLSAYISHNISLTLGNTKAENISAAILKTDVFELSNYAGIKIHGLIGYEFFSSFIVRINFINNTLSVFKPDTGKELRNGIRIPISIEDRKPYIFSEVLLESGEKISGNFIIDTGAGHPVSIETNSFKLPDRKIKGNLGIGFTGPISGYIGRVNSLNLGAFPLKNIIAAFPEQQKTASLTNFVKRTGNIGIAVLRRYHVMFDYSRSFIYIKPSANFNEPFEHDMAGIELIHTGNNYERLIVSRVEPDSAAEIAGIEMGDEILKINFKPALEMKESDIIKLFKSGDEKSFVIDLLKTGSKRYQTVILRLKKRI